MYLPGPAPVPIVGMIEWESLRIERTLNLDWHAKYIAVLCRIRSEDHPEGVLSVLLAHRRGFDSPEDLLGLLRRCPPRGADVVDAGSHIELLDHNDIYYRFLVRSSVGFVDSTLQLIHPATPAHVQKYTRQERRFVHETPDLYCRVVEPWIETQRVTGRLQWVENILAGQSEQDKVLWSDADAETGFVLLPDSKWDQQSMSALYLLALVRRRDLCSLRAVRGEHLPLLRRLRRQITETVEARYPSVRAEQLRMYVHYPPTYYYFHVHVVHVDLETPGCSVGVAVLLDDVIDNVENIAADYYQRRTLSYVLGCEHELSRLLADEPSS